MVTNLNLSYSQELGLLETHHFHLHPALCWERQSTLRVCAALGHSPEADPRAAHPCGIPRHRDNHRHCSAPCAMETFSHTAQSPPVPHTLKAWLSLLFIGDLKLLSLGWFLNLSPPALPGLANVNTRAENEESGWCSSSLMSVPSPSSGWTLLDLLKLLLTPGSPTRAGTLCHYRWLWMNLSGYWHSCTLSCSHGTDPRREDNQSHRRH